MWRMPIVNIVCINQGNYQGEGVKYVNLLHDMVRRNLPQTVEGRFTCFHDGDTTAGYNEGITTRRLPSSLKGWWSKLWLFSGVPFPAGERIVYFDLDVCITGALDDIIKYSGEFAILTDFEHPEIFNSSVMLWRSGFGHHIWDGWNMAGRPEMAGGDQMVIWHQHRKADRLQTLFPRAFVSYKQAARLSIPEGAKVVCFHGQPKPAAIRDGWVPRVWREGGISVFDLKLSGNLEASEVLKNIRYALASKTPFIGRPVPAHARAAIIIGGGPSINNAHIIEEIRSRWQAGAAVVALNNAWRWLNKHHIYADYHVLLDARDENAVYVPPDVSTMQRLYSAQCSRIVQDLSPARKTKLWLPFYPGLPEHLALDNIEGAFFGGGSTVGMMALSLFYHLGFREVHLFGYDSSYAAGAHHAYEQPGNAADTKITVDFQGQKYVTTPWMVAQVNEFRELAANLVNNYGMEIQVHGRGLLCDIAHHMARSLPPGSVEKRGGVWFPATDDQASNIMLVEIMDIPKVLSHVEKFDYAVQAGGNVGLWPREFVKHFKHVWTFEPDATNFKCMWLNLPENEKITRFNAALGDSEGAAALNREPGNCGAYSIDMLAQPEFPMMTIDGLGLPGCDLLQLDVEGYEYHALMGADRTIKKFHPVIVVEAKGLGSKYGLAEDAVPCLLTSLGYILTAAIGRDVVYTWQPTSKEHTNE